MLLKNAVTSIAVCLTYPNAPYLYDIGNSNLKNRNGGSADVASMDKAGMCFWNSTNDLPMGACFGTGSTPVTQDDYNVETEISDISATVSRNISYNGNAPVCTITITGTYTGSSQVSLSEFGIWKAMYYREKTNPAYQLLMYREVLSEPIVLNQNDNFTIVRDWTFN